MAGFTYKNTKAFTLAETLISLVVIGIVAALVIPSVLKNYNDKKYNTARLKALNTFGEAGKMASINGEINGQPTARAFVENVLSKYLKIVKVCDNSRPTDCGFPSQIQPSNPAASKIISNRDLNSWSSIAFRCGSNDSTLSTYVAIADGFSAKIFYNPSCVRSSKESNASHDIACMNVIYDMNGTKGPNHVGEDIGFVTTFYSGNNTISVAPGIIPYSVNTTGEVTSNLANAPIICAQKSTPKVKYGVPNIDELSSLLINFYLMPLFDAGYRSNTLATDGSNSEWYIVARGAWRNKSWIGGGGNSGFRLWCIRR